MSVVLTLRTLPALIAALVAAPTAVASAQQPSSDPAAGSPAGTIYQLPLDDARGDAAPKRPPAGSGDTARPPAGSPSSADPNRRTSSAGSTRTPTSALRSENGFGSSSVVPGTEPGAGGDVDDGDDRSGSSEPGTRGDLADTPQSPSAVADRSTAEASSGPSTTLVYLLLALMLAVGVAGGLATRVRGRSDAAD